MIIHIHILPVPRGHLVRLVHDADLGVELFVHRPPRHAPRVVLGVREFMQPFHVPEVVDVEQLGGDRAVGGGEPGGCSEDCNCVVSVYIYI